jgi:RNA polymerase sigma factor (TIGR02999 family)
MNAERAGHTLQATALVHEAYLRLLGGVDVTWESRGHFFGAAAEAMRRILVDHARRRAAMKRGGASMRVEIEIEEPSPGEPLDDVLAVDEALAAFEAIEPEKARIVKLRFFGGLTHEQIADSLGLSLRTVKRYWEYARAWLYRRINDT